MKKAPPIFLYQRQKILLGLLQVFGGNVKSINFQKYLFLFTERYQKGKSYEFIPFRFGCFSLQSAADKKKLIELKVLQETEGVWKFAQKVDYLSLLPSAVVNSLQSLKKEVSHLHGDALIRSHYKDYPYYAINSEIAENLLDENSLRIIREEKRRINLGKKKQFFTIGYEGKTFEAFLNKLIIHDVKLLCDVRRNPQSRKYGFSRKILESTLASLGIAYLHIPELGIVSDKRKALETQADYNRLFREYERTTLKENHASLQHLNKLMSEHKRIAITCFEAMHIQCHRGIVASALNKLPEWKYEISHL